MTSLLFLKKFLVSNDSIYSQNGVHEIFTQKMIPRNSKIAFVVKIRKETTKKKLSLCCRFIWLPKYYCFSLKYEKLVNK